MISTEITAANKIILGSTEAEAMYIGSTLIWQAQSPGRLPQGYTELEYISSTSTGGQYINMNILLYDVLNKQYDIATKFSIAGNGKNTSQQGTLFGCQENINPWPGTFIRYKDNSIIGRYIGADVKDNNLGSVNTIIELTEKTPPAKNVYNYNNSNKTHTWGTSLFSIMDANGNPDQFVEATLYYFKLFVNGTLVRDMVPCKNSNNVVGLYDVVNDTFYTSPNGAEFVAGPAV